jgi:hypothetical protein
LPEKWKMKIALTQSSLMVALLAASLLAPASSGHCDEAKPVPTANTVAAPATPLTDEIAARFNTAAEIALREMTQQAESRKMSGVAVVALIPGEKTSAWISRMQVVGSIVVNKSNVLGVAYSKAAEMADTLQNSGGGLRPPYKGEFGYKGGMIEKHSPGYLLAVFSGGKSEDDVAVAQTGLAQLGKAIDVGAAGK